MSGARLILGTVLLAGSALVPQVCYKEPVPEEHREYVGDWAHESSGSTLEVESDGTCNYRWRDGSSKTKVSGGAAAWRDGKFICGLFFEGSFEVDQPPEGEGLSKTMVLEGRTFRKVRERGSQ